MFWARMVFFAMYLVVVAAAIISLSGCATKPEVRTEYVTVTRDVDRIVRVRCEDGREPLGELPDDEADLEAVNLFNPDGSFNPVSAFVLAQKYVAARKLYRARIAADDRHIKACAAEE